MKKLLLTATVPLFLAMQFIAGRAGAAIVLPAGYANDFSTQPAAADWATMTRTGGAGDTYDPDTDVNANISAGGVTAQTFANSTNPPGANATATWNSTGFYLQTRPTGNRYTALMGKFANNTGTNATQVSVSYLFTIEAGPTPEDSGKGTRVYYSLTGLANGWTNVPALNSTETNNSSSTLSASLAVNWPIGASLYLLWVDDNASAPVGVTDPANQIDNFSLRVTAGVPLNTDLACRVTAPGTNAVFVSGAAVLATAAVTNGTAPHTVQYFISSGAGNTVFAPAGSSATPPFSVNLGSLTAGTYNLYAVVTDSAGSPASTNSTTNTFFVADTITLTLTAPADGASFDNLTPVTGAAMVAGGSAPYSVRFFLDGSPSGAAVTSAPYERNFGALVAGDHTIRATVTDGRGWASNSAVATVHITGPLGVTLTPPDGTIYPYGSSISVTGVIGGGSAPYAADFYVDNQLAGSVAAPPFIRNLGLLPVGNHSVYVYAIDSSAPTPQQSNSATNIITVQPNPITVTLTSPTAGQSVTAGTALSLAANAAVGAPLTVTNVQFFYDGASAGGDTSSPYSVSVTPAAGSHTAYAAATDSLGRRVFSATNQFTATTPTGNNDSFNNAIPLTGPIVTTTGNNQGAGKNFGAGEPNITGNFGGANVWWTWTATASGLTTIDTEGSSFNTLLGVYTGNAGNALTLIADNNDYNGNTWSRVQFNAIAGTTYRIQVDGLRSGGGFGTVATGSIVLHVLGVGGITIDSPASGAVFTVGDPIPVAVTITPDFPNGPATRVDFYLGGSLFASKTTAPFSAVATNAAAGSNQVYVVGFDSNGAPVQSPVVTVFVQRIGVTLLTPAEDTVYLNTNPITVAAHGYLPSGIITNIEFFVDGVKFGEDATAPFSAVWGNVTGGSHRLTAVGKSDAGVSYNSQPVNIGVATTLMPFGSVWRYLDTGSDQGTAWIATDFNDFDWASGPAPLGYGDVNGLLFPATTNGFGPNANAKYPTTYYRQAIVVSNAAAYSGIALNIQRDDGAVVYLNGAELARFNMPTGAVTYATLAAGNASDDGGSTFSTGVNAALFRQGTNVFAVEIHQDVGNSSDIWFQMQLLGLPVIIHNLSPTVALTSPTNGFFALAPPNIALTATAADADGSVAKVEYFADGTKVAESTAMDYSASWLNPSVGPHSLTAVAVDDQGARTESAPVTLVVYNSEGTPYVQITRPADGAAVEGGTNQVITAFASARFGVTNVQFLSNGTMVGEDSSSPFSLVWNAPFGTNALTAIAIDAEGARGTSAVVRFIAYPNTIAPRVATNFPAPFATVTNLTSITVVFSEPVQGVDASDLLLNTYPATGVTGSGSNYTFTFPQPLYGEVEVLWKAGHGITDFGYPANLPFDELGQTAQWEYFLIDTTPPAIAARTPAAGALITNLTQINVVFTEPVAGVDAADLLVGGVAATSVTGSGSNYTFNVNPPSPGTINITWAANHSIYDLAVTSNAFVSTAAGSTWSYTLDNRVVLVASNSNWQFLKGTAEASAPAGAWRQPGFDDSSWSNAPAPFFFGDTGYTNATVRGTLLSDMLSNYTTIYLRQQFVVGNRGAVTNLVLNHQSDDGFIAWLNGVEVWRYNVPSGELPYNTNASAAAAEPNNIGAAYTLVSLTNAAVSRLVNGTNVLAIQALNQNLNTSTDFGFNAQLYFFPLDVTTVPPRIISTEPVAGDLFYLTNVTINFSEGVSGLDAGDLLVNGMPAASVASTTNSSYTFRFAQPAYGPVLLTWATNHGIADFDMPPKSFDGAVAAATVSYTLLNPSSPRIATQLPLGGSTVTGLTAVAVTFTEPVAGVDAADFLVNGSPAAAVASADATTYTFTFLQPAFGAITIRWATNHGIVDVEAGNGFDPTRFGGQWNYTLINPVPSVALTSPTNNTYLLEPANVTLNATASDNDGTVSLVEFFAGATKVGEDATAPYSLGLSNLLLGTYVLRAVATDNTGLRGTSAPVVLNVVTSLPITLARGPYLNSGSPTSAVVRFRTDLFSDAVVLYGTDPTALTGIAVQSMKTNEHIVTLTGLQPDTRYYYSIGSGAQRVAGTNGAGSDYWFKTSPLPGSRGHVRVWALGDAGTAGNGSPIRQQSTRDAFYNYAATNGPADLMLMLGDNAYNSGTDSEYQAAVFDMYPTTLRNKFVWPTIGNHETAQSTTATDFPFLNMFSLPRNGEAGGTASGTLKYYSFDYANVHFVCLDSMTSGRTSTTPMALWLASDLDATAQEWIVVFFHHSLYTKGTHNSDTETDLIELRQNIIPILESHGADIVLMGHSHVYERSYLLDGQYGLSSAFNATNKIDGGRGREDETGAYRKNDAGRGVVYTIAGSAGQALGGTLDHPAHVISLNELGTVVIDVSGSRLDAKFLNSLGEVRDYYTVTKPEPTPAAPMNLLALPSGPNGTILSWLAGSSNQLGYLVERSSDGVNFTSRFILPADALGVLDSNLVVNVSYFYRVRATNALGASEFSNVAGVTAGQSPTPPAAPASVSVSADDGVLFFRSQMLLTWQDRSTNEAAFQIERSADGSTFVAVATVPARVTHFLDRHLASATPYYYRVRAVNSAGTSAPSFPAGDVTHPHGQFALEGSTVTFHAGSEGSAPVSYQWRFLGAAIPSATNEALVLNSIQATNEGEYSVAVTDSAGRLVSNPAYLSVLSPPRIVSQPQNKINLSGTTATFEVVASGTAPLIYQWRKNGIALAGEFGAALQLSSVQLADQGGYDALVYNDFGSITSRVATLAVFAQPAFASVPDIYADVLQPVIFTNAAIDSNQPPLQLVYSLGIGAPASARVDPASGRFSWVPVRSNAPSVNLITVRAVDATRPLLSNSTTFNVIVKDYVELTAGYPILLAGSNGSITIDSVATVPLNDLVCTLQFPQARLTNLTVEALAPLVASVSLVTPSSDLAVISMMAVPGSFIAGTQRLARLNFLAPTNQTSAFVPLRFVSNRVTRAEAGIEPTLLLNDGRAVVISTLPLVEARFATNGEREVALYGRYSNTYVLQYSTNLAGTNWIARSSIPMTTNLLRTLLPRTTPSTNFNSFWRARQ